MIQANTSCCSSDINSITEEAPSPPVFDLRANSEIEELLELLLPLESAFDATTVAPTTALSATATPALEAGGTAFTTLAIP